MSIIELCLVGAVVDASDRTAAAKLESQGAVVISGDIEKIERLAEFWPEELYVGRDGKFPCEESDGGRIYFTYHKRYVKSQYIDFIPPG